MFGAPSSVVTFQIRDMDDVSRIISSGARLIPYHLKTD